MDYQSKTAKRRRKQKEVLMKKRRRNVLLVMTETVVMLVLCITCYALSVANAYGYKEIDNIYVETLKTKAKGSSVVEKTNASGEVIGTELIPVTSSSGYRNILIVGVDNRKQYDLDQRGTNSDVLIIVSINQDTGDVRMVSIMRDTIMKMEEGTSANAYDKANNQFAVSGIADTVSMINRNLGLDIQEYVLLNWYGVAECINQMGGVELTIPNEKILWYFNGYLSDVNEKTGIWAPQLEEPGTYLMTGTQAVAFCRIRYGGFEDQGRSDHQREVIKKLLEKAKVMLKNGEINQLINVAETGLNNVMTNLKLPEILYLVTVLGQFNITESYNFPVNYIGGQYVGNYPKKYGVVDPMVPEDYIWEVQNLHEFLFDDDEYEVSSYVKEIAKQTKLDALGK